ncbi:hypothetical protein TNCV_3338691 [Trichonephila clavipes]|nr:hypothetical protein TNCV_3338691 [Trichonephila clavipes]
MTTRLLWPQKLWERRKIIQGTIRLTVPYSPTEAGHPVYYKKNARKIKYIIKLLQLPVGRGSLVVKETDSWLTFHYFEPCTAEDPPCRGNRCTLNMSRLKRPHVAVVYKLGEGVTDQVSSSSVEQGSNLRGLSQKALMLLNSVTLIFTHSLAAS